jgi:hypothetical protein
MDIENIYSRDTKKRSRHIGGGEGIAPDSLTKQNELRNHHAQHGLLQCD